MARLFTCGFELRDVASECQSSTAWQNGGVTNNYTTAPARSGNTSLQLLNTGFLVGAGASSSFAGSLTNTYYLRVAFYMPSAPAAIHSLLQMGSSDGLTGGLVRVNTSGQLTLYNINTAVDVGGATTMSTSTWHVIEMSYLPNTGAAVLQLDGVAVSTQTLGIASSANLMFTLNDKGVLGYADDFALNDSTGTQQNSWCGQGKVLFLVPNADTSRVGFTTGAGGTTSLFSAVKNLPPVGATSPGTATSQIVDATSNTTDNYVATVQSLRDAFVNLPPGSQILLAQVVTSHATSNPLAGMTNGISGVSNPVIAEATGSTAVAAAGTWPSNWTTLATPVVYSPAISPGKTATIEFRRATASTDNSMAAFMGTLIEYIPGPVPVIRAMQAVRRSTVR